MEIFVSSGFDLRAQLCADPGCCGSRMHCHILSPIRSHDSPGTAPSRPRGLQCLTLGRLLMNSYNQKKTNKAGKMPSQ